jgi:hypothetical protein
LESPPKLVLRNSPCVQIERDEDGWCVKLRISYCLFVTHLPNMLRVKRVVIEDCVGLSRLPEMPLLEELFIIRAVALTEIPRYENLATLNCMSCYHLTHIAGAETLKALALNLCSGLSKITDAESLPLLESLDINAGSVTNLPLMPNLVSLSCVGCNTITILPPLPMVEKFEYVGGRIIALPVMPRLESLICIGPDFDLSPIKDCLSLSELTVYNCPADSLPMIPSLRKLTIKGHQQSTVKESQELTAIPLFPSLTHLNISGCKVINSLPMIETLEELCCSFTRITTIPNYPRLRVLKCSHCKELKHLCDLTNVKNLDCSHSVNIEPMPNNFDDEKVQTITQKWRDIGLMEADSQGHVLVWKCVSPTLTGNLGFQYEIGTEFNCAGMACAGPMGALKGYDLHKATGSHVMAVRATCIYPVDAEKGVFHVFRGTPVALYTVRDYVAGESFKPVLIKGQEDDQIREVLGG